MKTSYFANLHNVSAPLSISSKAPDWYTGPQFKVLAPKYEFFRAYKAGEIDEAGYIAEFNRLVLAPLDPKEIFARLTTEYGEDVILLCYEKPGQFCHRRIVAEWFQKNLSTTVDELETNAQRTRTNSTPTGLTL